ncbi:hypothetical protein HK097_004277 [Rhizophlyctis rosea]|uniref:Short-chain dehydrogenase n=1 Tax=Rhizophlyctis rosea TaxID=64517 RepID=A0AAD5SFM7_9FUNG|nr:hypothetical protein HK097_004277 [Rhizophlyctis rosea]
MVSPHLSPASLIRLFKAGSFDESLVGFLMLLGNIAGQILFLPFAADSLLLKGLTDVSGQSTRLKDPKVVFITGASSGMGKHLAIQYSKEGVLLHLTGQNAERLEEVASACRAKGATVEKYTGDLTAPEFETAITAFDAAHPIDLLIANAGTTSFDPQVKDKPREEQYGRILETNVFEELRTIVPILKEMRKRKKGQIAIMSSINSFFGQTCMP